MRILERLLDRLFPLPATPPPSEREQAYWAWRQRIEPLGPHRGRILVCLGGSDPQLPGHFEPPPDRPLIAAAREHFQYLYTEAVATTTIQPPDIGIALLAAGLAACGQREMIGVVLDHVPIKRVVLDHGCGWCLLVPFQTLGAILPLPQSLREYAAWTQGSAEVQAVQGWYRQQHHKLEWHEEQVRYLLAHSD